MLRWGALPAAALRAAISLRSAPALKARSPAPVMTTLRMSESSRTRTQASPTAAISSELKAFIDSGRLRVITKV